MERLISAGLHRVRSVVGGPALSVSVWRERRTERRGGHPVADDPSAHMLSAVEWLVRAQDATPDAGFSRAYSVVWSDYFEKRGWQPSYPETTGYIIPTFYYLAALLGREDLRERASSAARWESGIQLDSGAVQGGVVGDPPTPSVFNTGQVLFGWLAALAVDGDPRFEESAIRAGEFLVRSQDRDGEWRRGNSRYARSDSTLYNARTSWALAEAGVRLGRRDFIDAARRNLLRVSRRQADNGWLPECCLWKPETPLLHTLAYAFRGLLEGGRVLEEEVLIRSAETGARAVAERVRPDGDISGQFHPDWSEAAGWTCLTGNAQMASVWLRLHAVTGEGRWLGPVGPVLRYLQASQNRATRSPGLRGGIKGSIPFSAPYGSYEVLNWATKFFVDALLRSRVAGDTSGHGDGGEIGVLA